MNDQDVDARTENVIVLREKAKVVGFIVHGIVFGCEPLDSEQLARMIDPEFGVISRAAKPLGAQ